MRDYDSWSVEAYRNGEDEGWIIVNEYGEEIKGGGFWSNYTGAKHQLALMIAEEIDNYEGPDPMAGVEFPFAANH